MTPEIVVTRTVSMRALAHELLTRIQGEYREMPGLRLTIAQAQRLFGVDAASCEGALRELVDSKFLSLTRDGCFVRTADSPRH